MAETLLSNVTDYGVGPGPAAPPAPESLLSELVRGGAPAWPSGWSSAAQDELAETAAIHGVHLLAARALSHVRGWPPALVSRFESQHERARATEVLKRAELEKVIGALDDNGVRPLVLKGTALAYGLYPSPALRPRGDTDLLIPAQAFETVAQVFDTLGFDMRPQSGGTRISSQRTFERSDRFGVLHAFDVHWKISNSPVFSDLLKYDELMERATALPGLETDCAAVCLTDALLHACLHRLVHFHAPVYVGDAVHYGDRLIWLYDIHLLVQSLTPSGQQEFTARARGRGLAAVCGDGIRRAAACFKTAGAGSVLDQLRTTAAREPAAALLTAGPLRCAMLELAALPGTADRLAYVREHLFPPAAYMRQRYGIRNQALLPLFYVGRGVSGALKRLFRTNAD